MEYLFIYLCIYIKHALKLFFHHTHTGIISVEFLYVELCGALKQDYGLTALDVLLVSHSSIENTFLALLYYFFVVGLHLHLPVKRLGFPLLLFPYRLVPQIPCFLI